MTETEQLADIDPQDNDLHGNFDAQVWAQRFVLRVTAKPSIATDESTMHAWFAGALMTGYDHAGAKAAAENLAKAADAAEREPKPGRLARVEVKGFRDLGVVRVSETTLAGEPMLHAECDDGSSADFPPSSLHFITWLPEGAVPEAPAAIGAPTAMDGWDGGKDADYDDEEDRF